MTTTVRYYADDPLAGCRELQPHEVTHSPRIDRPGLWSGAAPVRAIRYRASASPHKCDAACQTATRPLCECVCRGRNHGRFGMRAARTTTSQQQELAL